MLQHFFTDTLQKSDVRVATGQNSARIHLDKNEQSADVDFDFKKRVAEKLLDTDWNRYPSSDYRAIEAKISDYCGLAPENIVLGAGSAGIITTLLNYFALNKKHIVIAQPSYSLFDYHCKTYNIPYQTWNLNDDLEYDYENMPALKPGSVFIITSPNNPVGNTMDLTRLERLLIENPDSYIVLDGVYTEFCEADATPLVKKYPNLIVLRSFSKAFPVAGLRIGYLCASPETAAIVRKLLLQFSINPFALLFVDEMLSDRIFMENARKTVLGIVAERERMYHLISQRFGRHTLKVFRSEGNFLLIRVHDHHVFEKLMADLNRAGIKVLNTSGFPQLHDTFRVSVGAAYENDMFLHHLWASLKQEAQAQAKPVHAANFSQPAQKIRHTSKITAHQPSLSSFTTNSRIYMKNALHVALLLLLVFGACKKDDITLPQGPNSPNTAKRFMGYTYEGNKYAPLAVEYDSQGRVTRFDDGEDISTLTYSGNEVNISELRKDGNRIVFTFKGKLNAQGLMTEGSGTSEYNQGQVRQVKYTFERATRSVAR